MSVLIRPFAIDVPEASLHDLAMRLARTRLPDEINDAEWSWGTDNTYLRSALDYWAGEFNWREQEERLNSLPQFIASIGGVNVHFIHVRGSGARNMPLLLTHGWPGSFAEMTKIIPVLSGRRWSEQPGLDFDLVIPSIPGFGFSSRPTEPGMSPAVVASLFHELMLNLDYSTFGVQGGDLGAGVSLRIALEHPESVIGVHLNFPSFVFDPGTTVVTADQDSPGPQADRRRANWVTVEGGYSHMHSTKPQTIGYALNDSPAGLAAWVLEKFHGWSDRGGSAGASPFGLEELITNLSVYWFTETITSSMRIYKEGAADPLILSPSRRVAVPVAVASFPREIPTQPKGRVAEVMNLVRWTDMPRGGHFAALEEPELLANDIAEFFGSLTR